MSAPELPEDLSRWPDNPYELLQVSYGVGPRDLKRAYTRLIRTYKPEQFPEHFRRIREAYEVVLRQAEFFGWTGAETAPAPPAEPAPAPVEEPWQSPAPTPQPSEELQHLWGLACSGQEAEAYRRLKEWQERRPEQADLYPALYWLLALTPELDRLHTPVDWLVQGLRSSGLAGTARELFRRELEERPGEGLSYQVTRLLDLPVRSGLLGDLVRWRWQAAGRLQNWKVIDEDLERLRDRFTIDDPATWGLLLLAAVDQLAWDTSNLGWTRCRTLVQEINRLESLDGRWLAGLDRVEYLMEVSEAWHALRVDSRVPGDFFNLVPQYWTRPFEEVRPGLLAFLDRELTDPETVLGHCDSLHEHAAPLLSLFGQMLQDLGQTLPQVPAAADEPLYQAVVDFLSTVVFGNYGGLRQRILDFCLREAMAPEVIAEVIRDRQDYWLNRELHLSTAIQNDWPLRYVCLAHRLLWA